MNDLLFTLTKLQFCVGIGGPVGSGKVEDNVYSVELLIEFIFVDCANACLVLEVAR